MSMSFIPECKIKTRPVKPTEKDRLTAFWQALEQDRHQRHPSLSFRYYMRLSTSVIVEEFRRILIEYPVGDPETLELNFLKLRKRYLLDAPTPN